MIKFQLINTITREIVITIDDEKKLLQLIEIRDKLNKDCKVETYATKTIIV